MSEHDTDRLGAVVQEANAIRAGSGGSAGGAGAGAGGAAAVAPTPARKPLSVRITNREQIERLTPAQKQKLMRIVVAKRQLDGKEKAVKDMAGKENQAGDLQARPPLEKRGSNQFPLPPSEEPKRQKRQKTALHLGGEPAPSTGGAQRPVSVSASLSLLVGRIAPTDDAMRALQSDVRKTLKRNQRMDNKRRVSEFQATAANSPAPWNFPNMVNMSIRLVFRDGETIEREYGRRTELYDELPRLIISRVQRIAASRNNPNASNAEYVDKLIKKTREDLCRIYATHSRRLLAEFKSALNVAAFEINGTDPLTLSPGADVDWGRGQTDFSVTCRRIGIVDLRAYRAGKSLDESLYVATSGGQAWDVLFALRPQEPLHLNWKQHPVQGAKFGPLAQQSYFIKNNELFYVSLDLLPLLTEVTGFGSDALASLWDAGVGDDEKRGILRCLSFHLSPRKVGGVLKGTS